MYGFGENEEGQIGYGRKDAAVFDPTFVFLPLDGMKGRAVQVSVGIAHALLLTGRFHA